MEDFDLGSHEDRAMGLSARHAGSFMRAVMTLAAKLKTVGDFTAFLLSQFAAVGAGLSLGTDGFSLGNADSKGFDPICLFYKTSRSRATPLASRISAPSGPSHSNRRKQSAPAWRRLDCNASSALL
jgi:hypothetical protein